MSSNAFDDFDWRDEVIDVPISALEHYSYCPRQCGLIHVEQTFEENLFTVRGQIAHERVDAASDRIERGVKVARGIPLWSDRLGLQGKADLVEFRPEGPFPVEYKVGRRAGTHPDLQLCAQALCLEEMLAQAVPRGAIFYHGTHCR
jgi:CRISPR-associated exonuclease Cas4